MFQFLEPPRKSLLPRMTPSLWEELDKKKKLMKELMQSKNKLKSTLPNMTEKSFKKDLED